nr:MAG: hypothetical protein 2 [Leviviridae sp.]
MFSEPQTITIAGTGNTLNRVPSVGANTGAFKKDDGLVELTFKHSFGKRVRHEARLSQSKIAADPLLAGVNVKAGMSVYLVIDHPVTGLSNTEIKDAAVGLTAFLTAANITKLLGGEA